MNKKLASIGTIMIMVLICMCSGREKSKEDLESETNVWTEPAKPDVAADKTIGPDLNHNGIPEKIFPMDDKLKIWENEIELAEWFVGSDSVFLCTLDGEDYLLCYRCDRSEICQEIFTYSYTLYTMENNEKIEVKKKDINFDTNFGSFHHGDFDPDAIATFMDEINDLLAHSQILRIDSDLQNSFEMEKRLYDNLSWLDDQEPVFVRDESKTLQENLEDFQSAMTAVRKTVVPTEVEGLPITEVLEMRFSSGAGAWSTFLTLNPDGSFVGNYLDTNLGDDYPEQNVCQFHGQFGKVEKLTDASWLLTMEELVLDTGHDVGEEWYVTDEYGTVRFISREPYGFDGKDLTALKPGAQFILYSPDATGHEPGTELYGAVEFQSWVLDKYGKFNSEADTLEYWGLENMETGYGFVNK